MPLKNSWHYSAPLNNVYSLYISCLSLVLSADIPTSCWRCLGGCWGPVWAILGDVGRSSREALVGPGSPGSRVNSLALLGVSLGPVCLVFCFADTFVVTHFRAPACDPPPPASHLAPFLLDGGPGLQAPVKPQLKAASSMRPFHSIVLPSRLFVVFPGVCVVVVALFTLLSTICIFIQCSCPGSGGSPICDQSCCSIRGRYFTCFE